MVVVIITSVPSDVVVYVEVIVVVSVMYPVSSDVVIIPVDSDISIVVGIDVVSSIVVVRVTSLVIVSVVILTVGSINSSSTGKHPTKLLQLSSAAP
ncbi:hypothetical protein BDC45DRAFT_503425 [Circinella umbellata]|nr:hypothetical protein BDC45DRAFT_503425 [Circinella umbellata]